MKNSKNMEHYDYQSMKEIEIRRLKLEHEIQMKKLEMQEENTTWSLDYRLDFNERQTIKRLLQEEND